MLYMIYMTTTGKRISAHHAWAYVNKFRNTLASILVSKNIDLQTSKVKTADIPSTNSWTNPFLRDYFDGDIDGGISQLFDLENYDDSDY